MTALPVSLEESRVGVAALGSAESVNPAEWDALARRGFQLHHWFATAERCGWNARHVAVYGPGGIQAVVPAYLTGAGTLHDLHHRWLGSLRDVASYAGVELRPVLSVQSPFAAISEPLGHVAGLPNDILRGIFEALELAAEKAGAKAVTWPFVEGECGRLVEVARERGYAVLYSGAAARIRVRWSSLEEYVASRSKNVRRTIRADLGAIKSAGLRTTFDRDFEQHAPAMDRLYRDGFRRRNGGETPVPSDLFLKLARHASSGIRAHLTWSGDRLVGTSLNLMTSQVMEGTFAAFAPEHGAGPAFYNDLCYEPIRLACRENIAAIDLGPSALYAKVLRGAVLQRRMVLLRGTTPARHRLLRMLGQVAARRTEQKERSALGALWGRRCFAEEDAT